jgi:hypothetical protein
MVLLLALARQMVPFCVQVATRDIVWKGILALPIHVNALLVMQCQLVMHLVVQMAPLSARVAMWDTN